MVREMDKKFEIITDRLILRVPTLEDAVMINDDLNGVWHDLQMWMSWTHEGQNTLEATKAYIASVEKQIEGGGYPLIGLCRDTGKFVVATGLTKTGDSIETGYWVAREFLGRGYALEAANAVTRFGFGAFGLNEMHINHYEGNEKSKHIIQKLGFTFTHTTAKGHARCLDGEMLDVHHYVMRDVSVLPPLNVRWNT